MPPSCSSMVVEFSVGTCHPVKDHIAQAPLHSGMAVRQILELGWEQKVCVQLSNGTLEK